MKRVSMFLMVLLLLCAIAPCGFAVQADEVQPLWTYVTKVGATIDISDAGVAKVKATGEANTKGVTKTTITASLQQMKDGKWKEVKSWTVSSNSMSASLPEKSWAVNHGYSYRVVATAKAYKGTTLLEQGSHTQNYGYFK